MPIDRRTVLLSGLALAVTPALASASRLARLQRSNTPLFEFIRLHDGALATGGMTTGGNVLAVAKGDTILFVDAKFAGLAPTLRAEAEQLLNAKAAMLISTHHHGDHTSGNVAFDAIDRYAHANAKPRIESQHQKYLDHVAQGPDTVKNAGGDADAIKRAQSLADKADDLGPDRWLPTSTIPASTPQASLDLNGLDIILHHVGPGHTDNDLIVHLPQLNIIHAGDVIFNDAHPFIDRPAGASTLHWIESCRHLLTLCDADTVVIPGHGKVSDRDAAKRQIEYFERARDAARKAIALGTTRSDFIEAPFEFAADYQFSQLKPRSLGAIFDEISEGQ